MYDRNVKNSNIFLQIRNEFVYLQCQQVRLHDQSNIKLVQNLDVLL
nr:MAG TPA: hypothetical protein [Caudoviricetes sp.]